MQQLVIYNGYPLSVVAAVGLHILLLAAVIYWQSSSNRTEALELVQPTVIKALFIDENPQVINQQNLERQRIERIEQQRLEREREQQRQADEAARQAEAERQRQQEAAERAALLERQELERLRQEQLQRERDLQAQAEAEAERRRQQQAEAEAQREREAEARRQRENAAAQEAAAQAARTEYELVQSATAIIQRYVQEQWSRPPSARNGMRAVLRIQMLPTGDVTNVTIVESSNDPAFDRSAETAVFRAAPFTELQNLPINIFNQNFRTLSLIFQPEDLLN